MTAMSIKDFSGMIPRSPDHLLPDNAASDASNCDFSRHVLQALKGGLQELDVGSVPIVVIRSMYTLEGIFWYIWPTELTAYKSPVIGEIYDRIYYIEGGIFKVALSPSFMRITAASPIANTVWAAGVPNPVDAPTLDLINRDSLADYPAAGLTFDVWYTDGTANYGTVLHIDNVTESPWTRYSFATPAVPADAPDGAVLVVRATAMEDTQRLFQMNTATNATTPATSAALPGGVSMSLEVNGGTCYVNFSWGVIETRAYTFTEVNTWDEESGPSPVSLVSPTYLQDVQVTMKHPLFDAPGYGLFRPYKQSNIYRTYGGSQYIKAGNISGYVFLDSSRTVPSDSGTSLPSLTWLPAVTGMKGLVLAPNGWFAAFKDNMLYMSEPYRPHSWQYSMTFAKPITGICVGAQMIVVTTSEATYIVTGPHPASVTSMTLPVPLGGISQRGMCAIEGGIAFLSNDGLVLVDGSQASLDTSHRYFTREVWRSRFGSVLSDMTLAYQDGCVIAVSSSQYTGFILELDEAGGAMTRFDYRFDSMMRLPVLDTLYYSANGSNKIHRFRDGNPLDATWNSKQFISPKYVKLGVGFARMTGSGTITVLMFADETYYYTQVLDPSQRTKYFRLPPYRGALKWQVRISMTGACTLEDLTFAQSPDELKDV